MIPKFKVFMNDTSDGGTETNWSEIHGQNGNFTKENTLVKPNLDLEVNTAGKFEFTLPEFHNQYTWPKVDRTMVEVYELIPTINTSYTDRYNSSSETFEQPVTVIDLQNLSHNYFIDIDIRYDDDLFTLDPDANMDAINAVRQKFLLTHTYGTSTETKYISCQGAYTKTFRYAFQLRSGFRNVITMQLSSDIPQGSNTVPPIIRIYTEYTESTTAYKSIFYGRVSQIDMDFYKSKIVKCEGALAFFNDVVIRNEKNSTTPSGTPEEDEGSTTSLETFIETFLDYYNKGGAANATDSKAVADRLKMNTEVEFQNGAVTESKYIYRNINYENAFDVFSKKIIGAEGGYFLMVRDNLLSNGSHPPNLNGTGWKYILPKVDDPYPAVYHSGDNFKAKAAYSMNITDLKKVNTIDDIVTTVIPIGKYNSKDITIKNAEYINKSFKMYDDRDGSAIYDSDVSTDKIQCNYTVTSPDSHIIKYTYFAFYDPIGGCRIWVNSSTGGVTLGWYVTLQQGVRTANKTAWDNDRQNSDQAPSPMFSHAVSHRSNDTTFSIGVKSGGNWIDNNGVNYRTVYGWNYFVICATDPNETQTVDIRFNRMDRDADDNTAGSGTNNKYLFDYIQDPDLSELYGNKSKVVEFNDIDGSSKSVVKRNLMKAGADWLNRQIYIPQSLEVNAVDMTYLARNGEKGHYPFMLGEGVEVNSDPHNVSTIMTITKMTIDMDSAKTTVTLGTPQTPTLTEFYRSKKKGEYTKEYSIDDT